ncbi:MBL fold metallo-hydrolase [Spirochaetia bacterium 38H-sp]|uniref:MBL fold metallo-hydrolase n=1 Tax=Rarispira pelagica TaxID=3141764 RepID=A0ABU9UB86_9SPIR
MKVHAHFSLPGFSNTYILGHEDGGDAIVIDPGTFDEHMLNYLENNNYYLRYILITHAHKNHYDGIRTIRKIYDAKIYSNNINIEGIPCSIIQNGGSINLGEITVNAVSVPGHSRDSLVYQIEDMIFTGDSLSAGKLGKPIDSYGKALLITYVKQKLLSMPPYLRIFPGHGPPSLVRTEREYNIDIKTNK